jgi:anti-sigma factor RsiW
MSQIKRYNPICAEAYEHFVNMKPRKNGAFVPYEDYAASQAQVEAQRRENERLKAPVSRHNDADGILLRFFITGGRQYRYVKEDAVALEKLLNEWIASRATQPEEEKE